MIKHKQCETKHHRCSFDTAEEQRARDHEGLVHSEASGHSVAWKMVGIAKPAPSAEHNSKKLIEPSYHHRHQSSSTAYCSPTKSRQASTNDKSMKPMHNT